MKTVKVLSRREADSNLGQNLATQFRLLKNEVGGVAASDISAAIRKAQAAFAGAGEELGITSVDDIQALVEEIRYGRE